MTLKEYLEDNRLEEVFEENPLIHSVYIIIYYEDFILDVVDFSTPFLNRAKAATKYLKGACKEYMSSTVKSISPSERLGKVFITVERCYE